MAIADTITSMQTHTTNAYNVLNYATDLTGTNKNLSNLKQCIFDSLINSMSDTLNPTWENLPKLTTTPATSLSINNTIEAPMRIELGSSALEQTTYTGQNLYNYEDVTNTSEGVSADSEGWITFTCDNSSGSSAVYKNYYTHNLNLEPDTNYNLIVEVATITGTFTNLALTTYQSSNSYGQFGNNRLYYDDVSQNTTYNVVASTRSSWNGEYGLRTFIQYNAGTSGTIKLRISVIADTTITPSTFVYQPYVGGTASPNSSYPQDIHTISGSNTIKVEGKNLFDQSQNQYLNVSRQCWGTGLSDLITLINTLNEGNYTISYKVKFDTIDSNVSGTRKVGFLLQNSVAGGINTQQDLNVNTTDIYNVSGTFTITASNKGNFTNCYLYARTATSTDMSTTYDFQLEKGSTATTYEPYQSNTQTIDLTPYNLGSIGNYENRIFKNIPSDTDYSSEREEGGWYYKEGIGKVVLDENSDINYYQADGLTNNYRFRYVIDTLDPITTTTSPFKCNIYGASDILYNYVNDTQSTYLAGGIWYIKISKALIDSYTGSTMQEKFPNYLAQNNIVLYAKKVNTTYTQITGELAQELEQVYKGMLSYDGTTNISQVNNDLPFTLSVSAIEDLR